MVRRPEDGADEAETVARVRADGASAASPRYRLSVVIGPDRGATLSIDGSASPALVGLSPACSLRLTDRQVSRRHAALEIVGGRLRLTDLGSTNGTTARGLSIVDAYVDAGDDIVLGETTVRVEREGTSATALPLSTAFGRFIGASPEMRRLYPLCERVAAAPIPVIIEGETGCGKEVLAESLHETGPRAAGPFVVFDCTAVPASLMEATLFGHERGAFTGAVASRRGVFELAHGGTLFIDEIGDLELPLQAKLLRAIDRSEIQRVGSERWTQVDVRVIAATRRDLDREIQAGRFRDDLFFRLAVARIELPPLRRRTGDVDFLARHFWKKLGGDPALFPYAELSRLENYTWPGNVRELHNAMLRRLSLGELPPAIADEPAPAEVHADPIGEILARALPLPRARALLVEQFERRYVEHVVQTHGGNIARAAAASGIALRYFQILRARLSRS